jgi:hypothetical protein
MVGFHTGGICGYFDINNYNQFPGDQSGGGEPCGKSEK